APEATGAYALIEGTAQRTIEAHAEYLVTTEANGQIEFTWTIAGAAEMYVMAEIDGREYSSGLIEWAA
ncbi:MAG: hypothetical protein KAV00_18560, partial [Phycisphaerae bacterium]|nr:hypothetical protein [Phycisphaerae bacterium]